VLPGLLALPIVAVGTLLFGLPALCAALLDRNGTLPHRVARAWGRFVLRVAGVRVVVEGRPLESAAVYAANHVSTLDIPLVFGYVRADFRIIHKRSLLYLPVVGWYLWLARHVSIDRSQPFKARRSLETAAQRVQGGTSVVVFPEGMRRYSAGVGPFKKGSFVLAIGAQVPVVPVSLAGVERAMPGGLFSLIPATVRVRLHDPIATRGRLPDDAEALAREVREIVVRGCAGDPR
jgi:1-acyl-sn-glycerol-3-phosphate acyltransferase